MTDTIDFDEFNRKVIAEFRENSGKVGGMFEGGLIVLVHHIGAKSGIERIAPLGAFREDGRIYIFASKGGAPDNPAWYHNLVANPKVTVELGTETFPAIARVLTGAERDDIYAKQSATTPQFAEYQRKTSRIIPVIELQRADA
jgi:deazaflavin-dependent oxidoreductase (nitroreductase family)